MQVSSVYLYMQAELYRQPTRQTSKAGTPELLAGIGRAIGLVGAYFIGRAMQTMLFGAGTIDFSAFAAVGAIRLTASVL